MIETIVQAVLVFCTGGGLVKLLQWLKGMRGGATTQLRADFDRMAGERDRVAEERDKALAETDRQEQRADQEAARRRRLEESLSRHRRIIAEAPCLTEADLPPWPV
ncbi:hypothetical protein ACFOWY_06830 [Lysinibacter cavernae]